MRWFNIYGRLHLLYQGEEPRSVFEVVVLVFMVEYNKVEGIPEDLGIASLCPFKKQSVSLMSLNIF